MLGKNNVRSPSTTPVGRMFDTGSSAIAIHSSPKASTRSRRSAYTIAATRPSKSSGAERGLERATRHDLTRREIDLEMPGPHQQSQPHRHDVQHHTEAANDVQSSELRRGNHGEGR